jgi:hypothetical protein
LDTIEKVDQLSGQQGCGCGRSGHHPCGGEGRDRLPRAIVLKGIGYPALP